MQCPKCLVNLDPTRHGDLIFDGQIWCDRCHDYHRELIRPRDFPEIEGWSHLICQEFGFPSVHLAENDDPRVYRREASVLMAEAYYHQRLILFYPPGCRLTTLCHELAHIYTGQDHTREWARMFAQFVAWVKSRLDEDRGPQGFQARLSIYAGVPKRVY